MSKHTPGPWFRDVVSGMGCDVRAATGRKIACTFGVANSPKGRGQNLINAMAAQKAIDDANAHLIAAAPEMLDALKAFPMLLVPAGSAWGKQVQEWQDIALAAIAKAEGR